MLPHCFWISVYLLAMFGALGVHFIYLQIYLRDHGFSYQQIGLFMAMIPTIGMLASPSWGVIADASRDPRKILGGLLILAPASHLLLVGGGSFATCFLVCVCIALFYQPILPLQDSLILRALHLHGGDYGRLRIWGSLGFAIPSLFLPFVWNQAALGEINWTVPGVLFWGYSCLALLVFFTFPVVAPEQKHRISLEALHLFRNEKYVILLLCVFLSRVASSALDGYQTVYFEEIGIPVQELGLFLSFGPLSEIATIFYSQRWMLRFGSRNLMALCLGALVVRLMVTAWSGHWLVLSGIQGLHCLTFGTQHVITILLVNQVAGDRIRSSAQTLTAVVTTYLARLVGLLLSGVIAEQWGIPSLFGIASGVAVLSLLLWWGFYHDSEETSLKVGLK